MSKLGLITENLKVFTTSRFRYSSNQNLSVSLNTKLYYYFKWYQLQFYIVIYDRIIRSDYSYSHKRYLLQYYLTLYGNFYISFWLKMFSSVFSGKSNYDKLKWLLLFFSLLNSPYKPWLSLFLSPLFLKRNLKTRLWILSRVLLELT